MSADRRLRPFRRREALHRALYGITLDGPDGTAHTWAVDVRMNEVDWEAALYRDGVRQDERGVPAAFPVPGGTIEVDASLYGVTRIHLVRDSGREQRLAPAAGTAEYLRERLARRHPRLSRTIGWLAIGILLTNLVLAVPQAVEIVSRIPEIADRFGSFASPVALPWWLNAALVTAGVLAAVERVLTRRRNRVLDIETLWSSL
ncbi:hypothetical protein [Actinomadura sp. WMMB 499]|uniref:hypothetical protein n=1 Tax=Actinomadura sp. WMMB 499 TaxID=1219491 RepID=UPI001248CE1C|nr:hypothetical protein [Actinomadura sp. WMMB 499]QFG22312.1 hypothetical protein F7P10_15435 [Actinomadura sp. WMMB 499]